MSGAGFLHLGREITPFYGSYANISKVREVTVRSSLDLLSSFVPLLRWKAPAGKQGDGCTGRPVGGLMNSGELALAAISWLGAGGGSVVRAM